MLNDTRRPMPAALRRRLREIPRREVLCRDVDRLYRATRTRARAGDAGDPNAERHLEECPRCGELYATLASALAVRHLPLPRRLAADLGAIARHPRRFLPVWIADARYAAAACYLLAALALSVAGDASALLRETTATVSSKTQAWVGEGEARGRRTLDATAATLEKGLDYGWDQVRRFGASCGKLYADASDKITTTTRQLTSGRDRPVEGDTDDTGRNDRR